MKNLICGLLFLLVLNLSIIVRADEVFRVYAPGRFDSYLSLNYFKSEANFASNGSQQSLPSGYSFQVIDTAISGRYVLFQDLGLHAGMNISSSESIDIIATRRNSTLNYVDLGGDYSIYQGRKFAMYVDLTYRHAVEKIATDTDSSLNSDGASEVLANVTTLFDVGYMQPFLSGGVNYRMEGLSTLLSYKIGVQSLVGRFVFGGALNGYISVIDDSKTGSPAERELITNRVDATSKKFYAINPNLLDSDLYLRFMFTPNLSMHVNGGYTLTGSNSALGLHFGGGVSWGFGGDQYANYSKPSHPLAPLQILPTRPQNPKAQPTPPVNKFQEDTSDGVNQDYFKPVTPSQDPYFDKVQEVPPVNDVEEEDFKVNSKKVAPTNNGEGNDYKIKLKKTKKRRK